MERYIGVKLINAKPMNRQEYNDFRGWTLPADENGADEGYLVEYVDGGKANTSEYEGYVSWSPCAVFANAYKRVSGMSFGLAIEQLKLGAKVARSGWNGKNMFIFLREGRQITGVDTSTPMGGDFESLPHFCMKTSDGKCCVGWLASQTDMLATDWEVVE